MMLPILLLTFLPLIIYQTTFFVSAVDPTIGFTCVPLDSSHYNIQKPYDVSLSERYSFSNGVHKFWIYPTDKPFQSGSTTQPRTEIRVTGYDYTSGIRQFEGYAYVPSGTSGVCIQQVFGASSASTAAQLRVYDGSLTIYRSPTLSTNIYNRWFKVNVIHDANANNVKIYIDGDLKFDGGDNGDATHYFKFGVYVQNDPSSYMESRWRDIRICRK